MRKYIKEKYFKFNKNAEIIFSRSRNMLIVLPEIEIGWPTLGDNIRLIMISFDWLQFGVLLKIKIHKK